MAQMSILLSLTAKYHLTSSLDLLTELVGFLVSDGVADLLKGPTGGTVSELHVLVTEVVSFASSACWLVLNKLHSPGTVLSPFC